MRVRHLMSRRILRVEAIEVAVCPVYRPFILKYAFTKASLSFKLRPTLFTLPSLASASAALSKTFLSAEFVLSISSDPKSVSLLLTLSSYTNPFVLPELLVAGDSDVL